MLKLLLLLQEKKRLCEREDCNPVCKPDIGLNNVYQRPRGTESPKARAKTVLPVYAFEAFLVNTAFFAGIHWGYILEDES